jgi:hypothetical protein
MRIVNTVIATSTSSNVKAANLVFGGRDGKSMGFIAW